MGYTSLVKTKICVILPDRMEIIKNMHVASIFFIFLMFGIIVAIIESSEKNEEQKKNWAILSWTLIIISLVGATTAMLFNIKNF
jgi:uncharacterized membrane protein YsdA (DUF1294 family)